MTATIHIDANRAQLVHGHSVSSVDWREVTRVLAFKRDLLTTDLICLRIEAGPERSLEVNEEVPGWDALLRALQEFLPGVMDPKKIYALLSTPAFAANETVIFDRHAA
jgi:hypothetical protein